MRRTLNSVLAATCLMVSALSGQTQDGATAYADVNIVDVDRGTVLNRMTVIVAGGVIMAIQSAEGSLPPDARVLSLAGYYLVPGLIDAHVHLLDSAGARNALLAGITTARNMGSSQFSDVAFRDRARADPGLFPEIQAAGYHIQRRVPEELLVLHPELEDLPTDSVATEHGLRRLARVQLAHGVDVVKTGGDYQLAPAEQPGIWRRRWLRFLRWLGLVPDPTEQPLSAFGPGPMYQPMFSPSDFIALAEEANGAGLELVVHAHADVSARSAALAGAASVEHGTYLSDSTLAIMASQGVFLVPSLSRTEWRGHSYLDRVRAVAREAYARGVPLAAGTDAQYIEGAPALAGELQAMERAGLPRLTALRAGTVNAARLLGIAARTGIIREGLEADFLVVSGNPLDDLTVLDDPILVVSDGLVVQDRR